MRRMCALWQAGSSETAQSPEHCTAADAAGRPWQLPHWQRSTPSLPPSRSYKLLCVFRLVAYIMDAANNMRSWMPQTT